MQKLAVCSFNLNTTKWLRNGRPCAEVTLGNYSLAHSLTNTTDQIRSATDLLTQFTYSYNGQQRKK